MHPESGFALAVGLGMALVFASGLLVCVLLFFVLRRYFSFPLWTLLPVALVGLAMGPMLFDWEFPEYREARETKAAAPLVEVVLPDGFHGPFWMFFDSSLAALPEVSPGLIRITLDDKGMAHTGLLPNQNKLFRYGAARYAFRHRNGSPASVASHSLSNGAWMNTEEVFYTAYFAGTDEEQFKHETDALNNGTSFPEEKLFEGLRRKRP